MKEVCGYKSLDDHFYEKKVDCEKADLQYKIKNVKRDLDNFNVTLSNYLFENSHNYRFRGYDETAISKYVLDNIAKLILRDSDMFIAVIKQKDKLKNDLDVLNKQYNEEYNKPWWFKVIWWK